MINKSKTLQFFLLMMLIAGVSGGGRLFANSPDCVGKANVLANLNQELSELNARIAQLRNELSNLQHQGGVTYSEEERARDTQRLTQEIYQQGSIAHNITQSRDLLVSQMQDAGCI